MGSSLEQVEVLEPETWLFSVLSSVREHPEGRALSFTSQMLFKSGSKG